MWLDKITTQIQYIVKQMCPFKAKNYIGVKLVFAKLCQQYCCDHNPDFLNTEEEYPVVVQSNIYFRYSKDFYITVSWMCFAVQFTDAHNRSGFKSLPYIC